MEPMRQARSGWGKQVNRWGLLGDFETAMNFREFSNSTFSDEAPFYIYEIFRVGFNDGLRRHNGLGHR